MAKKSPQSTGFILYFLWTAVILFLVWVVVRTFLGPRFFLGQTESFETNVPIDYYVIHHRPNLVRAQNIEAQTHLLGKPIAIFDAVYGKDLDTTRLTDFDASLNVTYHHANKNRYGCYLSHLMLVKAQMAKSQTAKSQTANEGYTVVFEDDFRILDADLDAKIRDIVHAVGTDAELIYLGNLNDNHGDVVDADTHVYRVHPDQDFWGTHAYIIRNASLPNIHRLLLDMDTEIDHKYAHLIRDGHLTGYVLWPVLVSVTGGESIIEEST